jgi:hypothetical protein
MQRLFNVTESGRTVVFTTTPVEGINKTAAVAIAFMESDFKDRTPEQIAAIVAARINNAFRVLEQHITLTAKAK